MKVVKLKQERTKRGWTQDYIAESIGIVKSGVHDLEVGRRKPSYDVLCKLEDLFNLTHRQLFAVVDDEEQTDTDSI